MKNQLIMFLSVIVLLSLSSCLQDHPDVAKIVDIAKEIKVTASIVGQNDQNSISTRASDETWANGDAIGIFMKKKESVLSIPSLIENAKYDFTSDYNFVAATSKVLYFPFDSSKVDFIAYYPFKEGLKGIEYDIDVSKQNDLTKIDLLYSNNVVGKDRFTEIIKFDFKHQLVNVILNFTLDATAGDLKGLIAEISNLNTKATFLLSDGTIKSQSESDTIAFNMNADGTKGQAILLPLDSLENKYLIVKHKGLSYKLNLGKIKNIISFEKGTKYIYNITIKPNLGFVIKSLTTSIENWIPVTSEEIIADEGIPVEDEAGTVGEEVVPPVEDEGPIEGEVPGGDVDPNVGDGTQAKPYSIAQAKLETGKTKVWVKGYIVGAYKMYDLSEKAFVAGKTNSSAYNIAIADSSSDIDSKMVFPVNLEKDKGTVYNIQVKANIFQNPKNLLEIINVYGDIRSESGGLCVTNIKQIILNGVLTTINQ